MSKSKIGIRIGNYRIKPLGIAVLALILLIIIACVIFFVNPFGMSGKDSYYTQLTATATPTASPTPTPTPTATPTPTPTPTPRAATIRILGEITADTDILTAASDGSGSYNFSDMFSYVTDLMSGADYTIGTVQGSMGGTVDPSGETYYRTPASMITALKEAGVDMLDLAIDHGLDGNFDDLFAAISNCQSAGMDYVGAASSAEEKNSPRVVEVNGIKIGFVSYTATINGLEKKVDSDKLAYAINYATKKSTPKEDIQACTSAGAELIVAFMGWGTPYDRNVSATQQKIAQYLCDAGADVIIGYNPAVVEPASWLETTDSTGTVTHRALCMCSMGNFLSGQRDQYRDSGIVLQFSIEETSAGLSITNPVYIPTYVWRQGDEGSYKFYTLLAGQWLETAPEEMNYTQFTRIKEVWAEVQSIMGTNVVSVYSGVGDITSTAAPVETGETAADEDLLAGDSEESADSGEDALEAAPETADSDSDADEDAGIMDDAAIMEEADGDITEAADDSGSEEAALA